jgi:uncharacterized membrane protein YeaQ/YmgE (transglycosylase-associated protein family)
MIVGFIVWILVGAVAGWLAGLVVKGGGFGFFANAVLGIVGAAVAGYVLPRLGFFLGHGLIGQILHAAIGSVIILVILSLVPRLSR